MGIIISQIIYQCPVVNHWVFCELGRSSYEIYLIHMGLIQVGVYKWVEKLQVNIYLQWIIGYLFILVVSIVLGKIFNKAVVIVGNFHRKPRL